MELEERVLFSAAPLAVAAIAPHGLTRWEHVHPLAPQTTRSHGLERTPHAAGTHILQNSPKVDVVLIDSQLGDNSQLAADAAARAKIFVYNGATDTAASVLQRVTAWADATGSRVQNLAVLSHGVGGAFELGNQWITTTSLPQSAAYWRQLSSVLTAGANIEIFGCNVAAPGTDGQALLNSLASITHAAVFASTDVTGAGGNWTLEAASAGADPASIRNGAVPLNTVALARYSGDLNTIAIDTTTSAATASTGASSLTFSHTVNSGSDSILVVEVGIRGGGANQKVTSVTFSGRSLTFAGSIQSEGNNEDAEIWYLTAPPVGTANVVVTIASKSSFAASATEYFGVSQTTPLGTVVSGAGNNSPESVTVNSAAGQLVIDATVSQAGSKTLTPGTSQTLLWTGASGSGGGDALAAGSYQAGAASVTMSWTQQAWHSWALVAVPLLPSTTSTVLANTNETLVNTDTANPQVTSAETRGSQNAVAMDGQGNYVVVWSSDNQDGSGWGVYARKFSASGTPLTGEIIVNQTVTGNQQWARVACDPAGNFVVTWTSSNQNGETEGVYARCFAANGASLTGEFQASATVTGAQSNSVITLDTTTGNFVIAWDGNGPGDSNGVFFRRFSANGTALDATDQLVNTADANSEINPAATYTINGQFVIAWEVDSHVYFQCFARNGAKQGSATQIDLPAMTSSGIAIAADAAGDFIAVNQQDNAYFFPGVWGRSFHADGSSNGNGFYVASGDAASPSIVEAPDGSFAVVYQMTGSSGTLDVFAQKYNADRSTNGSAFLVNQTTAGAQSQASAAGLGANNFVVVWSGQGAGDSSGVFARQFGSSAAPPTASDDSYSTHENTGLNVAAAGVLANDTASSGNLLTAVLASGPANGSVALNADGSFAYTPNAYFAGADRFTYYANDGTANSNLGTVTITVSHVNQAPAGANNTVTMLENASYAFAAADFGFSDPHDSPPNNLLAVKITTLPGSGTLSDGGAAVTAGQSISVSDIDAAKLVFAPAAGTSGAPYASFTFQVQDDGGMANGGVDIDPNPKTMTVNVVASNIAPVLAGANNMAPIAENDTNNSGTLVSALIAGQVSDADGQPAAGIAVVGADNANGTWQYTLNGGNLWTAIGAPSASAALLLPANANAAVRFVPNANFNGTVGGGLTFRAWDQTSGTAGGIADTTVNGGNTAFSTATASSSIAVLFVNHAPQGADNTVATLANSPHTFAAADFGFSDPNDTPPNNFLAVKITALPVAGTLTDRGAAVSAGQFISVSDIAASRLVFTPAANASGAPYAAFTFQVQDDGGAANGGADLDPSPKTMTVNVTWVNQAPTGTNNTVTTLENGPYTLAAADFGFSDANNVPPGSLLAVKIATLPGAGSLSDNGTAVTAGQFISVTDINAGKFIFTPATYTSGTGSAAFTFQVQNNGGTANGGTDIDPNPKTMTVNVTWVNQAPQGTSNTVATPENTAYTFAAADFGFSDLHDSPPRALLAVKIAAPPGSGFLTDHGAAITAGQFVSVADINAGRLVFTPVAHTNGLDYTSFAFQVQDNGGAANGGVDTDPTPRTMTLNVLRTGPSLSLPRVQTTGSSSLVFSTATGNAIVVSDDSAASGLVQVRLAATNGTIRLVGQQGLTMVRGNAQGGGDITFQGSVADVNSALNGMQFVPSAVSASLTIQATDQGGSGGGGPKAASGSVAITQIIQIPPALPADVAPGNTTGDSGQSPTSSDSSTSPPAASAKPISGPPMAAVSAAGSGNASARTAPQASLPQGKDPWPPSTSAAAHALVSQLALPEASPLWTSSLQGKAPDSSRQTARVATVPHVSAHGSPTLGQESPVWNDLDDFDRQVNSQSYIHQVLVGSALTATTGLSFGYVVWIARGGVLLTSVLAQMPAWRLIDPLLVLSKFENDAKKEKGDDETLDTIVESLESKDELLAEETA